MGPVLAEGPGDVAIARNPIGLCLMCQNMWHLVGKEIFFYLASQ